MKLSEQIIHNINAIDPIIVTPEMNEIGREAFEKIVYQKQLSNAQKVLKKLIKLAPKYNFSSEDLFGLNCIVELLEKYPELKTFIKKSKS